MLRSDRIDIMMPFYGRVDHMKIAVESVLSQSADSWRLVVIDDGYPDESIPEWFAGLKNPNVLYQRNDHQLGANGNYRKCLELVETQWFVMMGADDEMLPNYVEELMRLSHSHPEAGVIHLGCDVIDENGKLWLPLVDKVKARLRPKLTGSEKEFSGQEIATSLARGDWMYFPSIAWNTQAVKNIGFRQQYDVVQDLALALDVIMAGRTFVLSDKLAFNYRRHSQSDSSWRALNGSRFVEEASYLNTVSREFKEHGWRKAARVARWHFTSRLNSLMFVFKAIIKGKFSGVPTLLKAVFM